MSKNTKQALMPLNVMVLAAKLAGTGELRRKIFADIIAEHGGLGAMIYREFRHVIEPYEALSYMYEALDDVVDHWQPELRKASTELRYRVMCRIRKHQHGHMYVGGVRVPIGMLTKIFRCDIDKLTEQKLYDMYEESECDSDALEEPKYDWDAIKRQTAGC